MRKFIARKPHGYENTDIAHSAFILPFTGRGQEINDTTPEESENRKDHQLTMDFQLFSGREQGGEL